MTDPVPHGYPDWGRFQARADIILHQEFAVVLNAGVTRGRFFTGGVEHVAFRFDNGANQTTVTIQWYTTQTGGLELGAQIVETAVGGGFDFSVPVAGPWMAISITPSAFPTTITLVAWTVAGPIASSRLDMAPEVLYDTIAVVAAGAVVTTQILRTSPGMAHIYASSALAAWFCVVNAVNIGGTIRRLVAFNQLLAGQHSALIFLPAKELQVVIANNTGAAGAIEVSMVRSGLGMSGQG